MSKVRAPDCAPRAVRDSADGHGGWRQHEVRKGHPHASQNAKRHAIFKRDQNQGIIDAISSKEPGESARWLAHG